MNGALRFSTSSHCAAELMQPLFVSQCPSVTSVTLTSLSTFIWDFGQILLNLGWLEAV